MDHFAQRLDLDTRAIGGRLKRGGLLFLGTFSVPTGRYSARILIRDSGSDQSSLAVTEFDTASSDKADVVLFPASVDQWVVAPGNGASTAANSYVVEGTGRPTGVVLRAPVADALSFHLRTASAGIEAVEAQLLGQDGVAHPLAVEVRTGATGTVQVEGQVPTLPKGPYTLVVTRHTPDSERKTSTAGVILE